MFNGSEGQMTEHESHLDAALRRMLEETDVNSLPGVGKPLRLEAQNPYVPEDQRVSQKLMRDNGFIPDWVAERREIKAERERLLARIRHAARTATVRHDLKLPSRLCEEVTALNRRIVTHNLKIPRSVGQLSTIHVAREIKRAMGL